VPISVEPITALLPTAALNTAPRPILLRLTLLRPTTFQLTLLLLISPPSTLLRLTLLLLISPPSTHLQLTLPQATALKALTQPRLTLLKITTANTVTAIHQLITQPKEAANHHTTANQEKVKFNLFQPALNGDGAKLAQLMPLLHTDNPLIQPPAIL
jgi:hypothetical protein